MLQPHPVSHTFCKSFLVLTSVKYESYICLHFSQFPHKFLAETKLMIKLVTDQGMKGIFVVVFLFWMYVCFTVITFSRSPTTVKKCLHLTSILYNFFFFFVLSSEVESMWWSVDQKTKQEVSWGKWMEYHTGNILSISCAIAVETIF